MKTIQKEAELENEIVFVPVPIEIYKYFELLKRKNVTISKDAHHIYFIGDDFIQVRNSSGVFNTTYYYASGILLAENSSSGKRYYHPDHLGSISLITNSTGSIVEETFYLPYGDILSGGSESRYNYNSKEKDSTGLNYYGARYYKSTQGQFVQPDSIIQNAYNPQLLNRYSYVRNNPYRYTDPTGNFVDIALDIGFITYDVYQLQQEQSFGNYLALAADVAGAALPGVTGLGVALKTGSKASDIGKSFNQLDNVAKGTEKVKDIGKIGFKDLSKEAQNAINKIKTGETKGLNPHPFENKFKEGYTQLPTKTDTSYYTAHDVTTRKNPERIISSKSGETYYSKDHYKNFDEVINKIKKSVERNFKKK
ncbi:MAG: RHS repeat-associated core domain-containing protein [Nanoarchaeota archaeon]